MADIEAIADEILSLRGTGRQIPLHPGLTLDEGYAAARLLRQKREARGERVLGRKAGFTNRTIWPLYGVGAPISGDVFDTTVHDVGPGATLSLTGIPEPRIEPEIMFGLKATPEPVMDEDALLSCIDWIALGYEIVQSVHPGWRLTPPDAVAAGGLHGALFVGERHGLGSDRGRWAGILRSFELDLSRDGQHVAHGRGADVLDSPLLALRHMSGLLDGHPDRPKLMPGEIISTGTITDAQLVKPGETWTASPIGLPLPAATLTFR